mmetsp:Transcript_18315/g.69323  ORF Transcript_18315/g.69323 Transcript_18315/m.69323 type:complete len:248 (+) Transcript_18315:143-886(+)
MAAANRNSISRMRALCRHGSWKGFQLRSHPVSGLDVGTTVEKMLQRVLVASRGGLVARGATPLVGGLDVGTTVEEQLHHIRLPLPRCQMARRKIPLRVAQSPQQSRLRDIRPCLVHPQRTPDPRCPTPHHSPMRRTRHAGPPGLARIPRAPARSPQAAPHNSAIDHRAIDSVRRPARATRCHQPCRSAPRWSGGSFRLLARRRHGQRAGVSLRSHLVGGLDVGVTVEEQLHQVLVTQHCSHMARRAA